MFLKKLFKVLPRDPFTNGLDHFNEGRFQAALDAFSPLLDSDEEAVRNKARLFSCESHLNLAQERVKGDPERALVHFVAASSLQPRFADIHNHVGEISARLGRTDDALDAFRRALAINPRYFQAQLNLCELLSELGDMRRLPRELAKLRENCPPLYRDGLLELQRALEEEGPLALGSHFDRVRSLACDRVQVATQTALASLRQGDPRHALILLQEVVADYPQFPDLRHLLGLAHGDMGHAEQAIEEFRAALAINPYYQKARINLGISLMEQGNLDEARSEMNQVLEQDPSNPLVLSVLAEIEALVLGH